MEQIFLPKDQNQYRNFNNARPITKTCPIYKLLDTVIFKRLQLELNPKGRFKLEKDQIGFREGKGCEMNILKLIETLKIRRNIKGGKAWAVFIDLKSAFDKVNH